VANATGNPDYAKDKFKYDKEKDLYICPMDKELKRISKIGSKRTNYRCFQCADCPDKAKCTTSAKGRRISPTKYEENYREADKLFAENSELYKKRQMIVEHPFGTIKGALGHTYFLTRGNENVKNEIYLHCLIYNLKRVINIMGIPPLIEAIKAKKAKSRDIFAAQFCYFKIFPVFA